MRPHEALALAVPASRYHVSPRPYPAQLPPLPYGPADQVRKVQAGGWGSFQGRQLRLPKASRGQAVAFRPTSTDDCRAIRVLTDDLGTLDLREPAGGVHHVSEHLANSCPVWTGRGWGRPGGSRQERSGGTRGDHLRSRGTGMIIDPERPRLVTQASRYPESNSITLNRWDSSGLSPESMKSSICPDSSRAVTSSYPALDTDRGWSRTACSPLFRSRLSLMQRLASLRRE